MLSVLETIKGTAVINQVTIDQVSLPALAATVTKLDLGLLKLLHGIKSFDNESD